MKDRKANRLREYDYSQAGCYFVTVCVQDRKCLFGEIIEGEMVLNEAGKMVARWWDETENKFPHVELDEYVLMPNHLHGIVVIVGSDIYVCHLCVRPEREDRKSNEHRQAKRQRQKEIQQGEDQSEGGHTGPPLQEIIQWVKMMTTNEYINEVKSGRFPPFEKRIWQRSFYDHVIRDDDDLGRVREYIRNNPLKWALDEYNPDNRKNRRDRPPCLS